MDFKTELINDVTILYVNLSRATFNEAEIFKGLLSEKIETGAMKIVVDLSECEFIDSSFLGALVVNLKKATSRGGDLKLCGLQSAVNSMFELTRMNRAFEIFKSKTEAINSFIK